MYLSVFLADPSRVKQIFTVSMKIKVLRLQFFYLQRSGNPLDFADLQILQIFFSLMAVFFCLVLTSVQTEKKKKVVIFLWSSQSEQCHTFDCNCMSPFKIGNTKAFTAWIFRLVFLDISQQISWVLTFPWVFFGLVVWFFLHSLPSPSPHLPPSMSVSLI